MCARKAELGPKPEPDPELDPKPEPEPEPDPPAPVKPSEPQSPPGKPEPDPLEEKVSRLAVEMDKRVGDVERFLKETTERAEKAPLLGSVVRALANPDDWMPDFLREPKSPQPPTPS